MVDKLPRRAPEKTMTDIRGVRETIGKFHLNRDVEAWLLGEGTYLAELINVYEKDPDTFKLHADLRKDPLLILNTVLQSAETLFGYQKAYNQALIRVAKANGVSAGDISEIPKLLQKKSIERETPKVKGHFNRGGNLVLGLMGSGASGKGTMGKIAGMPRVVNHTTRLRRPGEVHGEDYYYIREMESDLLETLDIDTGYRVISNDGGLVYETNQGGQPLNYFEKYGPYVTTVHRPGRALHGTSLAEFRRHFESGARVIFFEHGPIQVAEAGEKLPNFIENAEVLPVCILPPKTGVLPLAIRIAVRTFGDPVHEDKTIKGAYKINDSYLESTIGTGQIDELVWTTKFLSDEKSLGIAYIVNDNLVEAVDTLKTLISQKE